MNTRIYNNRLYAEINPFGAELMSLKDSADVQYIWQGDETYWAGRAPVLFPVVGVMRGGRMTICGRDYNMPAHGFAKDSLFAVESSRTDSAVFRLESTDETRAYYPFDFIFTVAFELQEYSLLVRYTVENRSDSVMPFGVGGHPGFNVPLCDDEKFEDYLLRFPLAETCDSPVFREEREEIVVDDRVPVLDNSNSITLDHKLFLNDALILETLRSRSVELFSRESGRGVRVDFDGFDYLGIWQEKNSPFLCIEPWTCMANLSTEDNALEHKRGIINLDPGDSREFVYKITVF